MDNLENFNPNTNSSNNIKTILLIIFGIIIIVGVALFLLFFVFEKELIVKDAELPDIISDIKDEYPELIASDWQGNAYFDQKDDVLNFLVALNPSEEQLQKDFGIPLTDTSSAGSLMIVAKGRYQKQKGEWVRQGDVDFYFSYNLEVVQESLLSARAKSQDASIKSTLSGLRAGAELYHYDNDDSYYNFYYSNYAKNAKEGLQDISSEIIWGANKSNTWVACAKLVSKNSYYCVDNKGTAKETAYPCNSSSTSCF